MIDAMRNQCDQLIGGRLASSRSQLPRLMLCQMQTRLCAVGWVGTALASDTACGSGEGLGDTTGAEIGGVAN